MIVKIRDRIQQGAGVGMTRAFKYIVRCALFNDFTQVHNGDAVRHVPDDGQIMGERDPATTDERELGLLMAGVVQ
jgi:hypothetical protein